jgi:hypothetical protein
MALQYELKLLNTDEVLKRVEETQKKQLKDFEIVNKIQETLKPFEGKQITKRLGTAIEKLYPESHVVYSTQYGMYQIYIWGNGIDYDKRLSFLLGYQGSQDIYTEESFNKYNQCHFLDKPRHEALESKKEKVPDWVNRWNKAAEELLTIQKEIGNDAYPLTSIFDTHK